MARSRPVLRICGLLLCAFVVPQPSAAQLAHPTESQVKAVYLYNFAKFVRWQRNAGSANTFNICVLGQNPFGSNLDLTVAGESLGGKAIAPKNIANMRAAEDCRILFISSSEEGRLKEILREARHLNTLTVSDIPRFAQRGGMIEFVTQESRVRFEVNVEPIEKAGLTVSSELLKVAIKVMGSERAGRRDQ